jgi:tetratricopeptide (TPR) repeat protein
MLVGRGLAYWHMNDLDRADADFTQAVASDPKNWAGYYDRALVLEQRAKYDAAIRDLDAGLAVVPGNAEILKKRGDIYADLDDYARAIQDYDAAIAARPKYRLAYLQRAVAKEKMGDARGVADDRAHANALSAH